MTEDNTDDRARGPVDITRWAEEPGWAGIQTFMKLPLCLYPEDLANGQIDVAVAGEPWDGTAVSLPGARLGPRAIRTVDALQNPPIGRPHQHVRVDPMAELGVVDYGDCEIAVGDTERTHAAMDRHVGEILDAGAMPIMLGGDHSVTLPNVTALARRVGGDRVAIVQLDAHTDTAEEMAGVRRNNSTSMRRLIEEGSVKGANLHQIGLRGYWPGGEELEWHAAQGIRGHFMAEIEARGIESIIDGVVDDLAASGADQVWFTFDVDGVDPAFAPGTGSPEPGGLTAAEALNVVRRISAEIGLAGMDVVETNPHYDNASGITALLAHRVVLEALTGTAMRRQGIVEPRFRNRRAVGGPES